MDKLKENLYYLGCACYWPVLAIMLLSPGTLWLDVPNYAGIVVTLAIGIVVFATCRPPYLPKQIPEKLTDFFSYIQYFIVIMGLISLFSLAYGLYYLISYGFVDITKMVNSPEALKVVGAVGVFSTSYTMGGLPRRLRKRAAYYDESDKPCPHGL